MSDNENIYESADSEITFKAIFAFTSKSFGRMIVYLIAAIMLISVTVVPFCVFFEGKPATVTRIEFSYLGIEKGLDPNQNTFNARDIIAPDIVSKAIINSGLDNKIADTEDVRDRLTVEGVISNVYRELLQRAEKGDEDALKELYTTTYYPTRFDIKLRDINSLDITRSESEKLVDQIITEYQDFFKTEYAPDQSFSEEYFDTEKLMFDYIDYYDIFMAELGNISSFLNTMKSFDPSFVATSTTKKTFNALLTDLNTLYIDYNYYKSFIISNSVWRAFDQAKSKLETQIADLTTEKARYTTLTGTLKNQIENYSFDQEVIGTQTDGTPIVSIVYPDNYHKLQNTLVLYNEQLANIEARLTEYTQRLTNMKDKQHTPAELAQLASTIEASLAELRKSTKEYVRIVNLTTQEYYEKRFITNSLKTVSPAVYTRAEVNTTVILWSYIIAAVVAIGASLIVTGIKIKKGKDPKFKLGKNQPVATTESSDNTEQQP